MNRFPEQHLPNPETIMGDFAIPVTTFLAEFVRILNMIKAQRQFDKSQEFLVLNEISIINNVGLHRIREMYNDPRLKPYLDNILLES